MGTFCFFREKAECPHFSLLLGRGGFLVGLIEQLH